MANITRIKAKDDGGSKKKEAHSSDEPAEITRKVTVKAKNSENKKSKKANRAAAKKLDKAEKKAANKEEKDIKNVFFLFRPFVALGRYIRDSFRELRQVRWPNRKETWKMTFSVIIYVVILATAIMLLDALLQFIFNKLLGGN